MAQKRKKLCLVKGCQESARTVGCCNTHYSGFRRAVLAGEITWAQLETAGLIKRVRKASNTKQLIAQVKGDSNG